eukprot:1026274-Amphidinium_carterae.2
MERGVSLGNHLGVLSSGRKGMGAQAPGLGHACNECRPNNLHNMIPARPPPRVSRLVNMTEISNLRFKLGRYVL